MSRIGVPSTETIDDAKREFYFNLDTFKRHGWPAPGTVEYRCMFEAMEKIMGLSTHMTTMDKVLISNDIASLMKGRHALSSSPVTLSQNSFLQSEAHDIKVMENLSRWHFPMVNDFKRNKKFKDAIRKTINTMKKEGPQNLTILDIGTGSGILALFASEAVQNEGLQHKIVACEALPAMIDVSSRVFLTNQSDILLVPKLSTFLSSEDLFSNKADLLITETFDAGAFGEHVLETLDHAWKYLLNKTARVIPGKVELFFAVIESEDVDKKTYVRKSVLGNLSTESLLIQSEEITTSPYNSEKLSELPNEVVFLSDPSSLLSVNLECEEEIEYLLRTGKTVHQRVQVSNSGHVSCVAVWFKLYLDRMGTEVIFSHPDNGHCWEQAIFPITSGFRVEKGDVIDVDFLFNGHLQLQNLNIQPAKELQSAKVLLLPERYIELLNNESFTCSSIPEAIFQQKRSPKSLQILDASFTCLHSMQTLKQHKSCELFVALLNGEEKMKIDFVCEMITTNAIDANRVNCGSMPKTSEFDVLVFDPILLNGRLNPSVWTDLIPWLRLQRNCPKLFPLKVMIKCVLVESESLLAHSRMLEDPSHSKFQITKCFNDYSIRHLSDVSLDSVLHLSKSLDIYTINYELQDDSIVTRTCKTHATKDGTIHALVYWFEICYSTNLTLSSAKLFKQGAFVSEPQKVQSGQAVIVEFKMKQYLLDFDFQVV